MITLSFGTRFKRRARAASEGGPTRARGKHRSEGPPLNKLARLFFVVGVEPVQGVDGFGKGVAGPSRESMGFAGETDEGGFDF